MTKVRDDYILLDQIRFHFRDWGEHDAPPIVLLHGGTGHARAWDSLARAMSSDYRVLAFDQRGHGESGWATAYSTAAMAADLAAFVTALGLRSFDLLGHSMGGMNAIVYAAQLPPALRRLVIVDIGPDFAGQGVNQPLPPARPHETFASPEEALSRARAANPRADGSALEHRTRANLMLTESGRWTWRHDPEIARTRPPGASDEVWEMWRRIAAPALLVRGGESRILSAEAAARMVREHQDCRLVEVPGAGHSVPLDAPEAFLAAVRTFL